MQEPTQPTTASGRRSLGWPSAAALVIANMVGAGVFTTSGFALAGLGSRDRVLLAWLVGGCLALCGAVSYGALARRFPESGGEYLFLSRTVHPLAGFLAGWVSLLAGFTAPIAAAALALEAYLGASFGLGAGWIGPAAIAAAALMHGLRLRGGVALQNAAVAAKLLLIAGFVAIGVWWLPEASSQPAPPAFEIGAFAVTLVWISFAYSGWNAAVYVAGEVRDPGRNLQRALVVGTLAVMAIYLALNAVFLYAAPIGELAGVAEVGAVAAFALGGDLLRRLVSVIVALALFTSISSMVMAGPRVYAKMAEDGLFPRIFAFRADVPRAAVALQACLAIAVALRSGLLELLGYIGFTLGLSAAATITALVALRRREGASAVPIPGFPWTPGLFVSATLATAVFMALREPRQAAIGLATALLGALFYPLFRRHTSG